MLPSKRMNKKLETALRRGRRKTDLLADISAEKIIPQHSYGPGQRHPSPLPISARQQLTLSLYPHALAQLSRVLPQTQRNLNGKEERKTDQEKWKFRLCLYMRNYAGKRQKEENQDRQCKKKKIISLLMNVKLARHRTTVWLTSWH